MSISLEKKGLQNIVARVAIVLDASGSMSQQYTSNNIQYILDRVALVSARLDNDGELDTWVFASKHKKVTSVNIGNLNNFINQEVTKKVGFFQLALVSGLGVGNNEPPVMEAVLEDFKNSQLPVLVIFITDGGIYETIRIKEILIKASKYPIFWQYVGIAGSSYGVLEELDTMTGRIVDNANFFHVDDLRKISDDELFDRLLNEFPLWLNKIKSKGIIEI